MGVALGNDRSEKAQIEIRPDEAIGRIRVAGQRIESGVIRVATRVENLERLGRGRIIREHSHILAVTLVEPAVDGLQACRVS